MNIAGKSPLDYSGDTPNNDDTLIFNNETGCWTPSSVLSITPVNSGSTTTTDQAVVRWEGTTGNLIQNSVATLSNTGVLSIPLAPLCAALTFYQIGNTTDAISLVASTAPTANITITLPTAVSDTIATGTNALTLSGKTLASPDFTGIAGGTIQITNQYCFKAYNNVGQTAVTGAGGNYQIVFDTIDFQLGAGYDATTGVFTAPIAGLYHFTANIQTSGWTSSNTSVQVWYTHNTTVYNMHMTNNISFPTGYLVSNFSTSFKMAAGDTVAVWISVGGSSTANIGIVSGSMNTNLIGDLMIPYP